MAGSLSCSYNQATQLVTLTNMLSAAKSGLMSFTVSGITNPISTESVTGIQVRTLDSTGGVIDTGSGSWSVPNPATITGASWTLSGSTVVSVLTNMRVIFSLPFPVQANSIIEFTFPSDVTTSSSLTSYSGKSILNHRFELMYLKLLMSIH